jgi:hypothetical protein
MHTVSPAFGGAIMGAAMVFSLAYAFGDGHTIFQMMNVIAGHAGAALSALWDQAQHTAGTLLHSA